MPMECKFIRNGIRIKHDGFLAPCCGYAGRSKHHFSDGFGSYLNSDFLDQLENDLANNVWPSGCTDCRDDEQNKMLSLRQQGMSDFKSTTGKFIDIVLGRECNSDCVMCIPEQSSKIAARLKKHVPDFEISDEDKIWFGSRDYDSSWVEKHEFWDRLNEMLPELTTIKFLGGEPFLNKRLWKWFGDEKTQLYKKNIELILVTNGSIINPSHLKYLQGWKKLSISVSVDATGQHYEWIRHGLSWKKLNDNIGILKTVPDVSISTVATVGLFNVSDLSNLIHWMLSKDCNISFIPIYAPSILSLDRSDPAIIAEAKSKVDPIRANNIQDNIQLAGLKKYLQKAIDQNKHDPMMIKSMTTYYNNHRKHNLDWQSMRITARGS